MDRVEGALTPYEVYCFRCRVTFPVEARRCLHCGGPLMSRNQGAGTTAPPIGDPAAPDAGADETEEGPVMIARRFGGIAIWVLVALAAVIQNLYHRGPA